MRTITFTKMHGTGNDFIFVLAKTRSGRQFWTKKRIGTLCDRHIGIGADGLIVLTPLAKREGYGFRIYNADGSTAETCLNGLRCAAFLVSRGPGTVIFEPPAGPVSTRVLSRAGSTAIVRVDLGVPEYGAATLPPLGRGRNKITVTAISVGNPHLVVFVRDFNFDWPVVATQVQQQSAFPRGANVDFVRVINRRRMELRFFERGVGPTLSCGSGAVAATLAAMREDLVGNAVNLVTPGGELKIHYNPTADRIYLTGPVERIFTGEIRII
ncbi:diaminopimelate epimerase [Candidatus Zixiibacteriota bacterium]